MKVAIGTSSFGTSDERPRRILLDAGMELRQNDRGRTLDEDETIALLDGAEGWIAGAELVSRRVLEASPTVRAVARVGVGLDTVDLAAAEALGVAVSRTPDAPTDAVAEMTIGALLAIARELPAMHADLVAGRWKRRLGRGLRGARVLVVGYGRIGRRVAELLRAFGSEVLVCDPAVEASSLAPAEKLVTLAEGLAEADVITLHASGGATILDAAAFARMRPGALLLNAARGSLVDEDALAAALARGALGGCWLDVFREEPHHGPLPGFDRVLATPHAATFTRECRVRMEVEAAENLLRDLATRRPRR